MRRLIHARRIPRVFWILVGLGVAWPAYGVGFRLPNQGPKGIARGNAFVATADDPTAIYYNPAGITQLEGHNLYLGAYFISTDTEFESVFGGSAQTDTDVQVVPQIHYVLSPPEDNLSYGFGVYAPYGLGVDYGEDTPFSTIGISADLVYLTLHPVLAWEIIDGLSIGAGPTINYGEVDFERSVGLIPGDRFRFEGDDIDVGFALGVLWQPAKQWSFGLSFRSATELDFEGQSVAEPLFTPVPTDASLDFPLNIDAGISFRPNEKWNLEFNLDWTDWDSVNETIFFGTSFGDQVLRFDYESSFFYEFGVTRYFDNGLYLSAGYIYSENSAPDQTFTPLNPDANLHLGSVGAGWRGERMEVSVGYHFAYSDSRTVSGNESFSLAGESVDGEYETLNHAVNVGVTIRF